MGRGWWFTSCSVATRPPLTRGKPHFMYLLFICLKVHLLHKTQLGFTTLTVYIFTAPQAPLSDFLGPSPVLMATFYFPIYTKYRGSILWVCKTLTASFSLQNQTTKTRVFLKNLFFVCEDVRYAGKSRTKNLRSIDFVKIWHKYCT